MMEDKIANTEAFEILSYMDKKSVMKIPEYILTKMKENRDLSYITKIDKNDIFNVDNISKNTVRILCWLDTEYLRIKELAVPDKDIFEDKKQKKIENKQQENTQMIKYKKENIFEKILNKIKEKLKLCIKR